MMEKYGKVQNQTYKVIDEKNSKVVMSTKNEEEAINKLAENRDYKIEVDDQ